MKNIKKRSKSVGEDAPSAKRYHKSENEDSSSPDWDDELHEKFVSSIFEIGLRNASPAVILENMTQKSPSITSERVKSKLQKYRNNKEKSREEFKSEYEAFLLRLKAIDSAGAGTRASESPTALLEMLGSNKLLGGDVAAFLSYAVMKEHMAVKSGDTDGAVMSTQLLRKGALEYVENFAGTGIPFPELTEEEKKSSLGISMTFVMGLFLSMSQHLTRAREQEKIGSEAEKEERKPIDSQNGTPDLRPAPAQLGGFSLDDATNQAVQMTTAAYIANEDNLSKTNGTSISFGTDLTS